MGTVGKLFFEYVTAVDFLVDWRTKVNFLVNVFIKHGFGVDIFYSKYLYCPAENIYFSLPVKKKMVTSQIL